MSSVSKLQSGAFPLFKFKGILVSLHWSWLLVAVWAIDRASNRYESAVWAVAEYVSLFLIVLLHEFGHAFATRQVGGRSEYILLWPFGGIAYVNAPHRPGAHLWSIAAGPLVNVGLAPILWLLLHYGLPADASKDLVKFVATMQSINLILLIFNLLPVYPMDGGQILQALLWYPLGFAKALLIASATGLIGGVALIGVIFYLGAGGIFTALLGLFLLQGSWRGLQAAREMLKEQPSL